MQVSASRNTPSQPPPSHTPRAHNRLSGDMKNRAPLPVPSGTIQNGHSRNLSGFDMAARSPPNQSSKTLCSVPIELQRRPTTLLMWILSAAKRSQC